MASATFDVLARHSAHECVNFSDDAAGHNHTRAAAMLQADFPKATESAAYDCARHFAGQCQ
jgi:hypothetical protein